MRSVWIPVALAYLSLGVLLLVALLADRPARDPNNPSLVELLEEMDPERQGRWYRFCTVILAPVVTGILVVLAWPLALVWTAKIKFERWKQDKEVAEYRASLIFTVEPADLLEQVEVPAVEAREIVFDPIGSVPAVPFGFLNAQWQAFLAQAAPTDTVWSFRAVRDGDWGRLCERSGYALVRQGKVTAFVVTSIVHFERPGPSLAEASPEGARA